MTIYNREDYMTVLPQLEKKVNKISNDFIVSQGRDDTWTWRKWNSGIVEVWGRWSETLTNYSTSNNYHGYTSTHSLPFSILDPVVTYTVRVANGFAIPASAFKYATYSSINTLQLYALSNLSGSQSTTWVADIKGRWK